MPEFMPRLCSSLTGAIVFEYFWQRMVCHHLRPSPSLTHGLPWLSGFAHQWWWWREWWRACQMTNMPLDIETIGNQPREEAEFDWIWIIGDLEFGGIIRNQFWSSCSPMIHIHPNSWTLHWKLQWQERIKWFGTRTCHWCGSSCICHYCSIMTTYTSLWCTLHYICLIIGLFWHIETIVGSTIHHIYCGLMRVVHVLERSDSLTLLTVVLCHYVFPISQQFWLLIDLRLPLKAAFRFGNGVSNLVDWIEEWRIQGSNYFKRALRVGWRPP